MSTRKKSEDSIFRADENCVKPLRAARAKVLIDGQAYFDAFVRVAERAERSIVILAWDFDSRMCPRMKDDGSPDCAMGEFLNGLAKKKPELRIHVLDWDFPMIYGTDREFPPIYGIAVAWKPHKHIDFNYDDTHPLAGSHHQKIVVIDDKLAFTGGQDLACKRWDTPEHAPGDKRRMMDGKPYPPQHDVMVMVDGEAAQMLAHLARSRWRESLERELPQVKVEHDPWPPELEPDFTDVDMAISVTHPKGELGTTVRQIEALYLDMVAAAKDYIYIENQYFTSKKVGEAIAKRLSEPDGPEIVVVTRLLSHGWLEEVTMHVLRNRLVLDLRKADRHGKFTIVYPHIGGLEEKTCLDVHSKLMIVDDEWLRIGSSNLSNRSMAVDSECDATIEARGNAEVRKGIRLVRDRLLAEHMGEELPAVQARTKARGSLTAAVREMGHEKRRLAKLEAKEVPDGVMDMASLADMEKPISLDILVESFSPITAAERAAPGAKILLISVLSAVILLALVWRYTPLADIVTPGHVVEWARSIQDYAWAPWVLILAYTPASLIMFPRPLITMAAVVAFGPYEGGALALTGIVLSAVIGYAAGAFLDRRTVRRLSGDNMNRISRFLQKKGLLAMTLVRLLPIAPFQVVNVAAGAMRIRIWHFVVGTTLGMLPGLIAATVLGDQIVAALADPDRLNLWLIAAAAFLLAGVAYTGQRWFRQVEK